MGRIAWAGLLAAVVAAPAAAEIGGSTSVSIAFTAWAGPYAVVNAGLDPADPSNWSSSGLVNGSRPAAPLRTTAQTPFSDWVVGSMPLAPTSSVTMAFDHPFEGPENIISFTPMNATDLEPGDVFRLGTLRFTNGSWFGNVAEPSFVRFELTVESPTPALNSVVRGAFALAPRTSGISCTTFAGQIANADAILLYVDGDGLIDAAYAYEPTCAPVGQNNVADFFLVARFGSIEILGFANAGGGFTGTPPAGAPTAPPFGPMTPIPEPATWALLIAGFGLVGASFRSRRRAVA
jgi:hypothetical protein